MSMNTTPEFAVHDFSEFTIVNNSSRDFTCKTDNNVNINTLWYGQEITFKLNVGDSVKFTDDETEFVVVNDERRSFISYYPARQIKHLMYRVSRKGDFLQILDR